MRLHHGIQLAFPEPVTALGTPNHEEVMGLLGRTDEWQPFFVPAYTPITPSADAAPIERVKHPECLECGIPSLAVWFAVNVVPSDGDVRPDHEAEALN